MSLINPSRFGVFVIAAQPLLPNCYCTFVINLFSDMGTHLCEIARFLKVADKNKLESMELKCPIYSSVILEMLSPDFWWSFNLWWHTNPRILSYSMEDITLYFFRLWILYRVKWPYTNNIDQQDIVGLKGQEIGKEKKNTNLRKHK